MSQSLSVAFFRNPVDPQHEAKVAAVKALQAAGVGDLPPALATYFKCKWADDVDFEECLKVAYVGSLDDFRGTSPVPYVTPFRTDHSAGAYVDVSKLPKDVTIIKVELS
jgi:hypothetical protein